MRLGIEWCDDTFLEPYVTAVTAVAAACVKQESSHLRVPSFLKSKRMGLQMSAILQIRIERSNDERPEKLRSTWEAPDKQEGGLRAQTGTKTLKAKPQHQAKERENPKPQWAEGWETPRNLPELSHVGPF